MNAITLAMVAAVETSEAGDNMPEPKNDKAALIKKAGAFGTNEGKGVNSRPALAASIVSAASAGAIVEEDAADVWTAYQRGAAKAANIGYVPMPSEKVQVSKLKTFVRVGQLAQLEHGNGGPAHFIERVAAVILKMRDDNAGKPLSKSPFDMLLAASRAQLSMPDQALDDEQLRAILTPNAKPMLGEADVLGRIHDAMLKAEGDGFKSEELEASIEQLGQRIASMGGTTAEKKDRAKAAEKLAKAQANVQSLLIVPVMVVVPVEMTEGDL